MFARTAVATDETSQSRDSVLTARSACRRRRRRRRRRSRSTAVQGASRRRMTRLRRYFHCSRVVVVAAAATIRLPIGTGRRIGSGGRDDSTRSVRFGQRCGRTDERIHRQRQMERAAAAAATDHRKPREHQRSVLLLMLMVLLIVQRRLCESSDARRINSGEVEAVVLMERMMKRR